MQTSGFNSSRKVISYLLLGSVIFFLYMVGKTFSSFIFAAILAFLLFLSFRKVHNWFLDKLNLQEGFTALISTSIVIIMVLLPFLMGSFSLYGEASYAVSQLRTLLIKYPLEELISTDGFIATSFNLSEQDLSELENQIAGQIKNFSLALIKQTTNLIGTGINLLLQLILAMFLLYFLFRQSRSIGPRFYKILPFPDDLEEKIATKMVEVLEAALSGNLNVALLHGVAVGFLFWIFGLSTPFLYGLIAAIFSLVPLIGTNIVWIPGVIYLYMNHEIGSSIILAILSISSFISLEYFLKPLLLDKKLNLHPLLLFLSILGGLTEFGIIGLIFGPFFLAMLVFMWQIYQLWDDRELNENSSS